MSANDLIFAGVFIYLILRQVRGKKLTLYTLLLPFALVGFFGFENLHGFPTSGNDMALVVATVSIGLALGVASAWATRVYAGPDGSPTAKASPLAVLLWVAGTGSRLAFTIYASHGGGPSIFRFATEHHIDAATALPAALIMMALAEVVGRTSLLVVRSRAIRRPAAGVEAGSDRKPIRTGTLA